MAKRPSVSADASLAAWRRGRGRRARVLGVGVALAVAALVATDRAGGFGQGGADRAGVAGWWLPVAQVEAGDGAGPVVRLHGGLRVGLLGVVDVPGGGAATRDAAADAMARWIGDGPVRVRFARGGTRDAAGRRVGVVETAGGVTLNEGLLARGLAAPRRAATHAQAERYALLGRQARDDAARAASVAAAAEAAGSTAPGGLNSNQLR